MPSNDDFQDKINQANEQMKQARDAEKEAKKQAKEATNAAKKAKAKAEMQEGLLDWLAHTPLYYVAQQDRFFIREHGVWTFIKPEAMRRTFPIITKDGLEELPTLLQALDRTYSTCTYTFTPEDHPEALNLMITDDWVKPVEGKHHWFFDVLIQSLGCNKAENMEHIERVLAYKYLHPEAWRLPCLLFYGEGGIGKNMLVDAVLYTMYNKRTVSAIADNLISTFNSLLKGMVIGCINEAVIGKHENSKLTNTLNKARLEVNEKGIAQYTADNTPLYIIGSNDPMGGALLDRSNADRRFSVMYCEPTKTLDFWISRKLGISVEEAFDWREQNVDAICTSRKEVGRWLNHLIEMYGNQTMPKALHEIDYRELVNVQEPVHEEIIKSVFGLDDFDYISQADLYEGYDICCKRSGNRFPYKNKTFNRLVETWCKKHMPHIIKVTEKKNYTEVEKGYPVKKQKVKTVWKTADFTGDLFERNRQKYFDEDANRPVWKLEI